MATSDVSAAQQNRFRVRKRKKAKISDERKNLILLSIAIVLIILAFIGPHGGAITKEMSSTLFLIVAAVLMWVTMCIPNIAASLLIIVLMPLVGIRPSLASALSGFTATSTYFVIASVSLGLVITKVRLPKLMLSKLLYWSKGKISRIVLAFLLLSYSISMWISDMAAVIIALGFVTALVDLIGKDTSLAKRLLPALSLTAPVGAVLGGNSLVVGSTVNIVTVNMLNLHTGGTITFLEWLVMGLPACFSTLFIIWRVLMRLFKLEDLPIEAVNELASNLKNQPKQLKYENLTLVTILLIMVSWFSTTWIKGIDLTTIAIFGMTLLFIPKYGALSWGEFRKGMPWEIPFIGACSVALGQAVRDVGLTTLLSDSLATTFPNIGQLGMVFMLSIVLTLIVMAIPVGPATAAMMTIPAYVLGEQLGLNPMANVMVVGIFAANSCILPLNATFLLPYTRKMFTLKECVRVGICLSLIWIIVCTIWLPITTNWLYPVS